MQDFTYSVSKGYIANNMCKIKIFQVVNTCALLANQHRNLVDGDGFFTSYSNQKWTSSSCGNTLVWEITALEHKCKSSFLKDLTTTTR